MKTISLCVILGIFCAFGAMAEETEEKVNETVTLTVDQAVEYALKNSLSLKSADIELEMKKRAGENGWNILLPSVTATGTMSRGASNYGTVLSGAWTGLAMSGTVVPSSVLKDGLASEGFEDNESARWTAVGGISAGWNFNLAMIHQIIASRVSYEAGKISYDETLRDTENNVRKLFYGLLLAQENLKIKKTTLENSRQRYNQSSVNFKNGLVPELALLQAQVAYENQKPDVAQTEREFNQQLDTFAFLIGYKVGTSIVLSGSIEPEYITLEYDRYFKEYIYNSMKLKAIDKGIETLEHNILALNLSSYTPSLSVNYSLNNALIYGLDFDRWGDSDNWNDSNTLSFTIAWNLTNLLPWSSTQQTAKDLKQNLEKTKIQREMFLENQKIELRKNIDTITSTQAQIESMTRNVQLAQKSYDMTMVAYRNGTKELLDVRDAETSLNQAKLGLASQKFNYISAVLDLESILNTRLTNTKTAEESAEGDNK